MTAKPDPTTVDPAVAGKPDATQPAEPGGGDIFSPSTDTPFDPSAMGDPSQIISMLGPFFAVALIIGLAIVAFSIFCWWKIFSKAGFNGALALVFLAGIIPLVGPFICLGLFIWFAFADWPALKGQTKA